MEIVERFWNTYYYASLISFWQILWFSFSMERPKVNNKFPPNVHHITKKVNAHFMSCKYGTYNIVYNLQWVHRFRRFLQYTLCKDWSSTLNKVTLYLFTIWLRGSFLNIPGNNVYTALNKSIPYRSTVGIV